MIEVSAETSHATSVAIDGRAILIEGESGSGKSDLALRLIDRGAILISDDYTLVQRRGTTLIASPPPNIAGKIEVRGIGVLACENIGEVPVGLVVRSDPRPARMPDAGETCRLAGITIPILRLSLNEASAPIKVERALALIGVAP